MEDKPLPVDKKEYDHPEHHRDKIMEHSSEERYVPEQLKDLLLEQCGHRCTICKEPRYEFHHILYLEKGGKTEYENLIVLCPNCHTRVHSEGVPSEKQLHHYKLKEEVSYGLPVIARLSSEEKQFILHLTKIPEDEMVLFLKTYGDHINVEDQTEARKIARKNIGLLSLEAEGIIRSDYDISFQDADGVYHLSILIRITDKGIRWIRYIVKSGKVQLFEE